MKFSFIQTENKLDFGFSSNIVKAFVVTSKNDKNSIILRGGYDKGYKIKIILVFNLIHLLYIHYSFQIVSFNKIYNFTLRISI